MSCPFLNYIEAAIHDPEEFRKRTMRCLEDAHNEEDVEALIHFLLDKLIGKSDRLVIASHKTARQLHEITNDLYEKVVKDIKKLQISSLPGEYDAFLLFEFTHSLIDNLEITAQECAEAKKERSELSEALQQAKKTVKKAVKTAFHLKKERDAAVGDLYQALYKPNVQDCEFCKHLPLPVCENCNWEWRGLTLRNIYVPETYRYKKGKK